MALRRRSLKFTSMEQTRRTICAYLVQSAHGFCRSPVTPLRLRGLNVNCHSRSGLYRIVIGMTKEQYRTLMAGYPDDLDHARAP